MGCIIPIITNAMHQTKLGRLENTQNLISGDQINPKPKVTVYKLNACAHYICVECVHFI